jgi:hypothetical protein
MKIEIRKGLPYVIVSIVYRGREIVLENVLLDTGSAGSLFSADKMLDIGLYIEPYDTMRRIRGVGGTEFVFVKRVDSIFMDKLGVKSFDIEIGAMDYGDRIDGIIGMDFLLQVGICLDLAKMEIYQAMSHK